MAQWGDSWLILASGKAEVQFPTLTYVGCMTLSKWQPLNIPDSSLKLSFAEIMLIYIGWGNFLRENFLVHGILGHILISYGKWTSDMILTQFYIRNNINTVFKQKFNCFKSIATTKRQKKPRKSHTQQHFTNCPCREMVAIDNTGWQYKLICKLLWRRIVVDYEQYYFIKWHLSWE